LLLRDKWSSYDAKIAGIDWIRNFTETKDFSLLAAEGMPVGSLMGFSRVQERKCSKLLTEVKIAIFREKILTALITLRYHQAGRSEQLKTCHIGCLLNDAFSLTKTI
jgi:hypothetical protein